MSTLKQQQDYMREHPGKVRTLVSKLAGVGLSATPAQAVRAAVYDPVVARLADLAERLPYQAFTTSPSGPNARSLATALIAYADVWDELRQVVSAGDG